MRRDEPGWRQGAHARVARGTATQIALVPSHGTYRYAAPACKLCAITKQWKSARGSPRANLPSRLNCCRARAVCPFSGAQATLGRHGGRRDGRAAASGQAAGGALGARAGDDVGHVDAIRWTLNERAMLQWVLQRVVDVDVEVEFEYLPVAYDASCMPGRDPHLPRPRGLEYIVLLALGLMWCLHLMLKVE